MRVHLSAYAEFTKCTKLAYSTTEQQFGNAAGQQLGCAAGQCVSAELACPQRRPHQCKRGR